MKAKAESFKVLSVETRIKIIELLKTGVLSVNAIAEALEISQSAVSQHLRVLKQAGLVIDERKGYHIFYSLNRDNLDKCQQDLIKVCNCGCRLGKKKYISEAKEVLLERKRHLKKELSQIEKRISEIKKERR
ncbi:MAG: metalloregulator ArsR/SmtB family transcription factor [Nitrospinota bacterium]